MLRIWAKLALLASLLGLAGCGVVPESDDWADAPSPQPQSIAGWQHMPLPGKSVTNYRPTRLDGREALEVRAQSSASLLRKRVDVAPDELGVLRFSWKVPALMEASDMARRDAEDAVVRVVLSFDGDRGRLSPRDHMLSELAQLMTGEPLPYATLMYVWCPTRSTGSVIHNPRTDRIRKLVVESGPQRLNQWLDYERDIRADFRAVFGEEPGRLIGVALMTDSDNTRSQASAWYGPVKLDGAAVARHP
jgi:hypothetical protein